MGENILELNYVASAREHFATVGRRGERYDVVHDHSLAGPMLTNPFGAATVTTAHSPLTGEFAPIYRAMVAEGAHVVCVSHAQRATAPDLAVDGVIPHGLELSEYPFGTGEGDEQGEYLLFLGRFTEEKGAHLAIDAARAVGRRLLLAARKPNSYDRSYFEAEVQPRLAAAGDSAVWVGEADYERKIQLLRGASALLVPIGWNEPFGMVLLEAMASGTPVVAFRRGSVPELVRDGETGFVCDTFDEFVAGVEQVGKIDRANCRRHVEEHFAATTMTEGYLRLFAALADR
jgi:glycosyltransferase involved in cell wall biosynthesis